MKGGTRWLKTWNHVDFRKLITVCGAQPHDAGKKKWVGVWSERISLACISYLLSKLCLEINTNKYIFLCLLRLNFFLAQQMLSESSCTSLVSGEALNSGNIFETFIESHLGQLSKQHDNIGQIPNRMFFVPGKLFTVVHPLISNFGGQFHLITCHEGTQGR